MQGSSDSGVELQKMLNDLEMVNLIDLAAHRIAMKELFPNGQPKTRPDGVCVHSFHDGCYTQEFV